MYVLRFFDSNVNAWNSCGFYTRDKALRAASNYSAWELVRFGKVVKASKGA